MAPSRLAAAAVYLARVTLGVHNSGVVWTKTLEHYTGYTAEELKSTVLLMHDLQGRAEESDAMRGIWCKYEQANRRRVALKTVVRREDLGFPSVFQ
jgi:hypothetical protein